jgi:hypothetical protein
VLATRSPQLDNLNFEFDTISGDLAREDANLRPWITSLDTTMGALAVRQADLQGTLVHAASVFGDLSQALSGSTTQADLARIFQQGPQALSCASAIANYITPLVTAVNPYISFTAPYSLDTLLSDFVTASGYNTLTERGTTVSSGDALRVLPSSTDTAPPPLDVFHDAGGLTLAHAGYTNAQLNGSPVYAEQPPLTGASTHPTISGCAPPPGLP